MRWQPLGIALLLASLAVPSVAEEPPLSLADRVDAVFAEYDSTRTPGCSLGVIQGGELVYARGYEGAVAAIRLGVGRVRNIECLPAAT